MFENEHDDQLYLNTETYCDECERKVTTLVCRQQDWAFICMPCYHVGQRRAEIQRSAVNNG